VTTAFLNGDLDEDVYMHQPQGFVKEDEENKVCKLKKVIYGLKQSSRAWNKKADAAMQERGYRKSEYEPCVYFKIDKKSIVIAGLMKIRKIFLISHIRP
jgi:hypothetical protein